MLLLEAYFLQPYFIETPFAHLSVYCYHDNMQISLDSENEGDFLRRYLNRPLKSSRIFFYLVQKEHFDNRSSHKNNVNWSSTHENSPFFSIIY